MEQASENTEYKKLFGGLHLFHWLIIFLSLLLTLSAWYFTKSQVEEKVQVRFDREADRVLALVTERMQKYEDALWAGVAAIHSKSHGIDRAEWKRFTNAIEIEKKYPGINGLGVIYYVPPDKLDQFITKEKKEYADFRIFPAHEENEYWPITYIEPLDINYAALGLDMAHETNRFTAAKKARDTGTAQITGPIILVQDNAKTPGFLFYAPFYKGRDYTTVEERQKQYVGNVYAPFIMNKLMEGTLEKENRHVSVRIRDGDTALYDEYTIDNSDYDEDTYYKRHAELSLYGRIWVFDIQANEAFKTLNYSKQPTIILMGGIIIDILLLALFLSLSRERKRAMEKAQRKTHALTSREGELALIFNHVPVRIWYKDANNRIIRLNEAAARSMGGSASEFEGKDTYDLFPDMAKKYHEDDLRVINSGKPAYGIIEEYTPSNSTRGWVRTDKVPYIDPITKQKMLFVASQDITDLKNADIEREELIDQLVDSNEELERFAYIASHDLQEPLRMITNFTQLLERRYGDQLDDTAKNYINIASSSAQRMQSLVEDLLEYSRIGKEYENVAEVDCNEVMQYVLENMHESIQEKSARITYDALPILVFNPVRMSRLLQNIIGNSLKYQLAGNVPVIEVSAKEKENEWVFSIRDNGIGIKQEYCEQIFLPFKRLHGGKEYSGTGIGLAICRKIIENAGGRIWAKSEVGKGSEFLFTVPKHNT